MSLKNEARERGYQLVKAQPGNRILLLERSTGKQAGSYDNLEEARAGLEALPVSTPKAPIDTQPVGWSVSPQAAPKELKKCSNGGGSTCLCQSSGEWYFCAVKTCHFRAGCQGFCRAHFGQLKIFGDQTESAILHTQSHEEDGDLEEVKANPKSVSLKPLGFRSGTTFTPSSVNQLLDRIGIIGVQIRPVSGGWSLIDRDANVLGYNTDINKLVAEFLFEDDD